MNELVKVRLNSADQHSILMIGQNHNKVLEAAAIILDIAADTGQRLLHLKSRIKAQGYGWKKWVQDGNLPFGYEQAARYSKLAAHPAELATVRATGVTSIEQAVKAIEHIKKPHKAIEAEAIKVAKAEMQETGMRQLVRQIVGLPANVPADDNRLMAEMRLYLKRDTTVCDMLLVIAGYNEIEQIIDILRSRLD